VLAGCVQPALAPNINVATARVLDRLGIELVSADKAGCCGAVRHHLNEQAAARDDMRRNIDAWWPHVTADGGAEAIVVTASGCGVQVRDYGHLLADDLDYAEKAARISALCRDPSEILAAEGAALRPLLAAVHRERGRLAFHAPCTLQHGLKIRGVVEELLMAAGYTLTPVADGHLCCGSAGTYSVLQPTLAKQLRDNKLAALNAGDPALLATANIGCLTHLQAGSALPVRHWIELIDAALA
jgi:glycolate oxidase iron-sulfur subunit